MLRVTLRFYEELNDFLPRDRQKTAFDRVLPETTSVKDLIEGCKIPHPEVDLILVNSTPVYFYYQVKNGDFISVYPVFESMDISAETRLQERPLRNPQFLCDVNLGKLARYLRMAGIDTAYRNDAKDPELIDEAVNNNRALLTRDRRLLMHKKVTKGHFVRATHAADQLDEVLQRFDLHRQIKPFSRCVSCNGTLETVDKESIRDQLEPLTERHFHNFSRCRQCGRIYWAGSHRNRLHPKVEKLLQN